MKKIPLFFILLFSYTAAQSQKFNIRAGADYVFQNVNQASENSRYPSFNINAEYFFAKHFSGSLGAAYQNNKRKSDDNDVYQSRNYIINSEARYYISKNQDGFFIRFAVPLVFNQWITPGGYVSKSTWLHLNGGIGCRYYFNKYLGIETCLGADYSLYELDPYFSKDSAPTAVFGGLSIIYRFNNH